jgi:hypothetical protein
MAFLGAAYFVTFIEYCNWAWGQMGGTFSIDGDIRNAYYIFV